MEKLLRPALARDLRTVTVQQHGNCLLQQRAVADGVGTGSDCRRSRQIAVCTINGWEIDGYAKYTALNMRNYCDINGYDFIEHSGTLDPSRHYTWSKIKLVENCLNMTEKTENEKTDEKYDWIMWLDADIVITNKNIKIENIIGEEKDNNSDIIIAKEDSCDYVINTGVFLIKNSEWSKNFLKKWYNQTQFINAKWMDNSAFIHLYNNDNDVEVHTKLVKQRVLNSFVGSPYRSQEEGSWQKGDFIIHFAGMPNREPLITKFIEAVTCDSTVTGFSRELSIREQCVTSHTEERSFNMNNMDNDLRSALAESDGRLAGDLVSFVTKAYWDFLGRKPDTIGLAHQIKAISSGEITRKQFLDNMSVCEERIDYIKRIEIINKIKEHISSDPLGTGQLRDSYQICELANLKKWYVPEWLKIQKDLNEPNYYPPKFVHRKTWEWVQCIYGLEKLGVFDMGENEVRETSALGVGAGHEPLIYYFSNRVDNVIATDIYDENTDWVKLNKREGDPDILINIDKYAPPFPYRKDHISVKRMNGCDLKFKDNTFDFVWSISSIEHFGSHENSAIAMREIERVLKPGGIAAIATEYIINQFLFPGFKTYSSDPNFFSLDGLYRYIIASHNMKLVQDIDFSIDEYCLENHIVYPDEIGAPHTINKPHMILRHGGNFFFTSIFLFFRKE